MNDKGDKKLEHLVDKMMKETSLETPSVDFTSNVMSQVEVMANSNVTTYKPLISKPVWFGLLALLIGALVYSFFNSTTESSWLSDIDFGILADNEIGYNLPSLMFSETMLYSVLLFGLMFTVQIPLLRGYFNRRLSV